MIFTQIYHVAFVTENFICALSLLHFYIQD